MRHTLITILFSLSLLSSFARPAFAAVSTPTFPSCANPQGVIKVTYSDGTHGIIGSTATYQGKDAVYTLSDDTVTQCFCSKDGQGIQTNWWKASSLTEDEINILKAEGWIYIPAGNLWGLAEAPYVAKNTNYSCLSTSNSSSNTSSNSSQSNNNGTGGGEVLGVSEGDILGLAATGDRALVYGSFLLGIAFILWGIARVKKQF